jgi:hypothetical protein
MVPESTVVPVLDPGRGRTKQGYFWAIACDDRPWGGSDPPVVVYSYAPGRGSGVGGPEKHRYFTHLWRCSAVNMASDAKRPYKPRLVTLRNSKSDASLASEKNIILPIA